MVSKAKPLQLDGNMETGKRLLLALPEQQWRLSNSGYIDLCKCCKWFSRKHLWKHLYVEKYTQKQILKWKIKVWATKPKECVARVLQDFPSGYGLPFNICVWGTDRKGRNRYHPSKFTKDVFGEVHSTKRYLHLCIFLPVWEIFQLHDMTCMSSFNRH